MPGMSLKDAYETVTQVAAPTANEGLKKERAILVLWFLRHVYGIDDLEAYEFVCDGDNDQGVDGLFLEDADPDEGTFTLHVFQSEYPATPKNVGVGKIKEMIGTLEHFKSAPAIKKLLSKKLEPELKQLITRFGLLDKAVAGKLSVRGVSVTAGKLSDDARELVATTNANDGGQVLTAYDVFDLAPIVQAFKSPTTVKGTVEVKTDAKYRFVLSTPQSRIAVCAVPGSEIVKWPGINDRTLFDLNVRRELPRNRVRHALNRAIRRVADHPNFLAYHNGLTVVLCPPFREAVWANT